MIAIKIRSLLRSVCLAAFCVGSALGMDAAYGQNSSINRRILSPSGLAGLGMRETNQQPGPRLGAVAETFVGGWSDVPPPVERQLHINDRIMVRVAELFSVSSEGEIQSRKDVQYNAVLTDWIKLIGLKAIKPATQADGDPSVGGTLKQLFRAEGDMATKESLALNITCTIADIRPNGDVVLEGHKQIQVNYESWSVSLSGICRYKDIGPDNTVLSKQIANLKIVKRDSGHVRDSYKRGWLSRWIDEWSPF